MTNLIINSLSVAALLVVVNSKVIIYSAVIHKIF